MTPARPGSRWWLVVPLAAALTADVALTLGGQPAAYWAGDFTLAEEANPIGFELLARSPCLFALAAAGWLLALALAVLRAPAVGAAWLAGGCTLAHALGGCSWLVAGGPWGWVAAVAYLAALGRFARWCWRRAAGRG